MRRNRTTWGLLAALAGVALLVGGVAVASNMGFKFVASVPDTSGANGFNLSIPWNNNYTDANSLFNDLNTATSGSVERVGQWSIASTIASWFGPYSATTNFPVVKGESYLVYANVGGGTLTPVTVGSHDPNHTHTFNGQASSEGAYNAAAPYHQTYADANQIFNAINAHCGAGKLSRVARITPQTTYASWFGPYSATTNFPTTLGEGVVVLLNAGQTCTGFVWAHY